MCNRFYAVFIILVKILTMKPHIYVIASLVFLFGYSCKKEEVTTNEHNNLNGNWIEGSWTKTYNEKDSILTNGNWAVTDTIEDPSANTNWVHWQEPNDSLTKLTTNTSNNEASIYWNYVGDGYNNNPSVINVTGDSYQTNDTIIVFNLEYIVIDFNSNGNGLDEDYQHYVEAQIIAPFNGCKEYIELFKRQDD